VVDEIGMDLDPAHGGLGARGAHQERRDERQGEDRDESSCAYRDAKH